MSVTCVVKNSPPIVVEGLEKAYRRGATVTPVLCDVTFTVAPGECVFLVGPSGSGKTTLLSILGCVLSPDVGRVEILGHDVYKLSQKDASVLRRDKIGFLFQRFHLIRGLSAIENVALPLILRGQSERAALCRSSDLLDTVDLADRRHHQIGQLSVGQCQRVALARALVGDPELILADEPTAALDAAHGQTAIQLLRDLTRRAGTTVVVVTHDQRILPFADRVLQLENGKLAAVTHARGASKDQAPPTQARSASKGEQQAPSTNKDPFPAWLGLAPQTPTDGAAFDPEFVEKQPPHDEDDGDQNQSAGGAASPVPVFLGSS
jgi:putative ABC transport system ATP-binding protein